MRIEVISLRLVDPKESGLCGFADVMLDAICIRDFRIVWRNGRLFVEGAHATFKKDGQIRFNQIVNFPDVLKVQIDTAILTVYFKEKERQHGQQSE